MRITFHNAAKPGRPRLALALALVLFFLALLLAMAVSRLRITPTPGLRPHAVGGQAGATGPGQTSRSRSHSTRGSERSKPVAGRSDGRHPAPTDFSAATQFDLR